MKAMEQILYTHAKKYPLMEHTDAVKLIYQNVFGGDHLICLLRILPEELTIGTRYS